ncbi:Toxin RTX-I translocation ATP-binding protein [Sinobacterium norvegicum]|uniref:Toxin RTX-I translocation ATP-binding protein n=1 Tax=Sinobacterium norvegicum TaxID=1641715 RepID=A0ABM9AAJ3_9GAMM|nr:type I secretion system permease/ATPase [Sinobacterium norvegicum]CAH0990022.1 Toxin RTX-I translocation ATP-binding protein [Sinobacterium norvegicum]
MTDTVQTPGDTNDGPSAQAEIPKVWHTGAPERSHFDPLLDSLVVISKLYDKPMSATALSAGLPLVDNKLTPALLPRAADRAGLAARLIQRDLTAIRQQVLPAVLLLNGEQACVLTEVDTATGRATVIRPESGEGESQLPLTELGQYYTGFAIFIKTRFDYGKQRRLVTGEKEKHWFWDTLKLSAPIYKDVVIASILINLFVLTSPMFVRNVYDRVVPNSAIDTLWAFAIGALIVFSFDFLLKLIRTHFLDVAGRKSDIILSSKLFAQVQNIKLENRPNSVGSFAKTVQDFESIRDFITSATLTTLVDLPFVFFFLIVIFIFSGNLVLVPIVGMLVILAISLFVRKPMDEAISHSFGASSVKNGLLIETLTGLETVKTNRMEGLHQRRWEQNVGEVSEWSNKSRLYSTVATSTSGFVQQLTTIGLMIVGVYEISNHSLSMGGLIAAMMLAGRTIAPMGQVAGLIARYSQTKQAYEGVAKVMEMPVERGPDQQFVSRDSFDGGFELEQVSLNFPEQLVPAVAGVDLSIPAGSKMAIIGRIGCGKTTLLRMLMGLYTPTEGMIKLDGIDLRQIDPSDLRSAIGCVEQQPQLFAGSIRDNIVSGTPYASDDQIIRAASIAGVLEFSNPHPEGLNRQVGEGGRLLSGGQRQCVALARALLRDPKILIFDEPTSALDQQTERTLIQRLADNTPDKTIIVFTQRMAILDLLDHVAVMDQGKVLMSGPKADVMKKLAGK